MNIEQRLKALEGEYQAGQKLLAELDHKRAGLTQTLLRIEGALEVLRELGEEARPEPIRGASAG